MLLLCPWTNPIWFGIGIIPTPNANNVTNLPNWLVLLGNTWSQNAMDTNYLMALYLQVMWQIWKVRNDNVFSSKALTLLQLLF